MTIVIFIIVLGILILVHEWGHFIAAKKSGLIVEEFGFGFPPKLFSFKKNGTIYSINLLPLGGFVKILGENGEQIDNPNSFSSKSVSIRSLITISGVAMNFLLAVFLLAIGFYIGLPQIIDNNNEGMAKNIKNQIVAINADSPAEKAGLKIGDALKYIKIGEKNEDITDIEAFQNIINDNRGETTAIFVQRNSDIIEITVAPRINPPKGEGALGIAMAKTGIISYPWYKSIWFGAKASFFVTWEIIKGFGNLIKNLVVSGEIPRDITGPVGIMSLTSQAANLGFVYLLQFVALISLNLTVLNLMPFPALDGGRLLFFGIEKIKGGKVNPKIENAVHSMGLILILILFILITYRDILRLRL